MDYIFNYESFFGKKVMDFIQNKIVCDQIFSAGEQIHLDIFERDKNAPTIVFSHGMAGYGRLLSPYAYRLYNSGYNVILPDLAGYGHNEGLRGHWTWKELIANLVDACNYAKEQYNDNVYLAGGSMGGCLAYHAVCHNAPVKALASYCLFDFQDKELLKEASAYGIFTSAIKNTLKLLSVFMPKIRIPATKVSSYDNLSDSKDFNNLVKNDPLGGNKMSLKAAAEMLSIALPIKFEDYDIVPTLVIQPSADKMTPAKYSLKAYNLLKTDKKKYVEVKGRGHWVYDDEGVDLICTEMVNWFKGK
jgi:alpha-beta hydrolase superfamily lysophospholipase